MTLRPPRVRSATLGADALVVGGGVIGRAIAFALAAEGAEVTLVDASKPRASAAAAGILGAQLESTGDGPLARLCLASRAAYPAFAARIEAASGRSIELRPCGVMMAELDARALEARIAGVAWQRAAGLAVEQLSGEDARRLEPALSPGVVGAVRFPDDGRVDPPSLLAALEAACATSGVVEVRGRVRRLRVDGGRVVGVDGEAGAIDARSVVVCAGSWSNEVEGAALPAVEPVRGQMLELRAEPGLLRGVVEGPGAYLSPRDDGRVLVGSTTERVGFDDDVTVDGVRTLMNAAVALAPALGAAAFSRAWAGLRPAARDELPVIGETATPGLFAATGHYRNGVLLAAITAEVIAGLVAGRATPHAIAAFGPAGR